ncbi:MAG: tyrosine--tRNA ligase [Parcubacteria group bacterium RIFCSPLOWO2_01_FULL_40_65]|nr:MAG: tyrosine--tRNA ligase [Parcubacteria group bacterium RIFCSPHIGHO2_01_FULL_40_30]OHB19379.1 MAG: tyrosine--tRNA ligase [Parcubacteria group bacterium RIFCSPHIGHO2_02_FULL_40_12]OHB21249.1 MAG: tyrosine--tRNA ligase [Parcubacteria group bacterium RIFCSPLOWO2_01_FULL_40_65]OHB23559.1 MAG: tyrosine--tRNA ligase [Parcubacteria group bacterium RIFCSPLOWO2_02_FULL_40_12]OHB24315.1 MAG: tyrosine--tRNA ligase [Parcubacteria group bacterium RIFCSPLOWO2_12_FULL_40_10]
MARILTDEIKIKELLRRGVEKIYPSQEFLEQRLKSGEELKIYLGIDPTGPDLHLGHSVQLLTLKRFEDLGHKTILVVGDFTARIGDPSGRDQKRVPLTEKQVKENEKKFKEQAGKVLNFKRTEIRHNSEWLSKFKFEDVLELASRKTVQQLLDRDMFRKRIEKGDPIGGNEFMYPLMQGFDSVALEVDGEIGATDQTFNMLVGRDLEKVYLGKEKFVFITRLLINPKTGEKMMSKTAGDYISLRAPAPEMYAGVMALPDEVVFEMFELCTEVSFEKIGYLKSGSILAAKHELAHEITKIYHEEKEAFRAREEFVRVFSNKEEPTEMPSFSGTGTMLIDFMIKSGLAKSRSEAKQLVEQGAVRINKEIIKIGDQRNYELREGDVIQVGPRKFAKITK